MMPSQQNPSKPDTRLLRRGAVVLEPAGPPPPTETVLTEVDRALLKRCERYLKRMRGEARINGPAEHWNSCVKLHRELRSLLENAQ